MRDKSNFPQVTQLKVVESGNEDYESKAKALILHVMP